MPSAHACFVLMETVLPAETTGRRDGSIRQAGDPPVRSGRFPRNGYEVLTIQRPGTATGPVGPAIPAQDRVDENDAGSYRIERDGQPWIALDGSLPPHVEPFPCMTVHENDRARGHG